MIEEFKRKYFNAIYNPIYDFSTATSKRYFNLQVRCIELLQPSPGNAVLCAGLGTGNEIPRLLEREPDLRLTGFDYSPRALARARRKAARADVEIDLHNMDARRVDFPAAAFDRVLCIHVIDFVPEVDLVAAEIRRVLKPGGRYVVTFPSDTEGVGMVSGILRDHLNQYHGLARVGAFCRYLAIMPLGLLYLPLMLRSGKQTYSRDYLEQLFRGQGDREILVEEDPVYHDYIVCGVKSDHGEI